MGLRDRLKGLVKQAVGRPDAGRPPAPTAAGSAPLGAVQAMVAEGYYAVAPAASVRDDKPGTFPLQDGTIVAVFRREGKLYCIDNACAHEDGPVGEGEVSGCTVKCPYHEWEYDFTTGKCLTDPERRQSTWLVKEAEGQIWVGPLIARGTATRGGDHNDGMKVIVR